MRPRFSCEFGHTWEASPSGLGPPPCPFCGSAGAPEPLEAHTIDLHPSPVGVPEAPPAAVRPEGQYPPQIAGYDILAELDRGGVAIVFRALQTNCQRLVALKVLSGQPAAQPAVQERFRREAHLLARLDHPHIVPVYDAGGSLGRPFYAMKLLEGGSLRRHLPALAGDPVRSARLLLDLAEAVAHAHDQGVIHGDLKPGNVLFDRRGAPYLCDFGAARAGGDEPGEAGVIFGTPAYAAPEVMIDGGVPRPAADIYALGVILYELLTGRLPFAAASPSETVRLAWATKPPRPGSLNADCPRILEDLCLRSLRKEPDRRPASAREFADTLRDFLATDATRGAFTAVPALPTAPAVAAAEPGPVAALRAGANALADGLLVLDAAGIVAYANPAAGRILGRDLSGLSLPDWLASRQWLGADAASPLSPESLPPKAVLRGEPPAEVEAYFASDEQPHGAWLLLGAQPLAPDAGLAAGVVVTVRDVTARMAERHSAGLYHSLISSLRLNLFRKDLRGRYTFVGHSFGASLGRPAEEILGRTDFDLFPEDLAILAAEREEAVHHSAEVTEHIEEHAAGRCQPGCRCRLFRDPRDPDGPEGEPRYFQMLLAPAHDEAGRVAGIQGAFWDITARRRAERRLEEAAAALKQANAELARSNGELQQFAYAASHDLQEPLRMVASFTQLLRKRYHGRLDDQADRYIGLAVDGATRMQRLINDLLAYSRVGSQPGVLVEVSAVDAYEAAVQNLGEAIRESGAAVTRGPLPCVLADAAQLTQLFQNLIGNAVKFRTAAPPQVHLSAGRDGPRREWTFTVRDNGIGIEPRHLERIFVIFQRLHTQQEYPGSGVGLAICRKIVERHGGRLWAESEPGRGSSFHFTLPAAEPARAL